MPTTTTMTPLTSTTTTPGPSRGTGSLELSAEEESPRNDEIVTTGTGTGSNTGTCTTCTRAGITTLEESISKIEADIGRNQNEIKELEEKIHVLQDQIKGAEDALLVDSPNLCLETLFQTFPSMISIIHPKAKAKESPDQQKDALRKYINQHKDILEDRNRRLTNLCAERSAKEQSLASLRAERSTKEQRILEKERHLLLLLTKNGETVMANTVSQGLDHVDTALLHVQETFRFGFERNIGLVEIDTDTDTYDSQLQRAFKLRNDIRIWKPCDKLQEAWALLDLKTSDPKFCEGLVSHLPSFKREIIVAAWVRLLHEFVVNDTTHMGKRIFQLFIYIPFSFLLMAAAGGFQNLENYRAEQEVIASRSVRCKLKEDDPHFQPKKLSIMSDGAVTLSPGYDAFGMMEVKASAARNDKEFFRQIDNCTMMTAVTAIIASQCIEDTNLHQHIAIPFFIATGTTCSLYVTTLDKDGIPRVQVVEYPDGTLSDMHDVSDSSTDDMRKCFITMAVLLNNFKCLFDAHGRSRYNESLVRRQEQVEALST